MTQPTVTQTFDSLKVMGLSQLSYGPRAGNASDGFYAAKSGRSLADELMSDAAIRKAGLGSGWGISKRMGS